MIRTIEEIRRLKMEGKRKWGKDLLEFLTPYFESGRTYEEVISILSSEYDIDLDLNEMKNLKFRYSNLYKVSEQKTLKTSDPKSKYTVKKIEETEDIEIVQNQDNKKVDISKFDFRTPTPKPTNESWKK